MKKKLLALFLLMLSLCLCFVLVSCEDTDETDEDDEGQEEPSTSKGLEYQLSSDKKSYIVKGIGSCKDKDIVIPETYKGLPVTEIGKEAFRYNNTITGVKMPSGVKFIGEAAFNSCENLTEIVLPSNETFVDDFAFDGCSKLTYNSYDNGLYLGTSDNPYLILMKAKDQYITTCEINSGTKRIQSRAFSRCYDLTSIEIPEGVVSIGTQAFEECPSMTELQLPNSVTKIGTYAFGFSFKTFNYNICDNAKYIGNEENPYLALVNVDDKNITSFVIKENTRFILNGAFGSCKNLTNIEIPNNIVSIDDNAFYWCVNLKSVTICNGVQYIGYNVFGNCEQLESIVIPSSVTQMQMDIFNGANRRMKIYCEAESKPDGWNERWNSSGHNVTWGYKG